MLSLLWLRFDPWPENFHMLWTQQKKKKKKKERKKEKEKTQGNVYCVDQGIKERIVTTGCVISEVIEIQ